VDGLALTREMTLMTVTIELKPELEASLAALAADRGLGLPQFVAQALEKLVSNATSANALSPAERAAAWRASVQGLPIRPVLSDEAVSRADLYAARGE
jgi:hypothetical protein